MDVNRSRRVVDNVFHISLQKSKLFELRSRHVLNTDAVKVLLLIAQFQLISIKFK